MAVRVHLLPAWVGVCLLASILSVAAASGIDVDKFRMKVGDDPRWAAPDLDDADWEQIEFHDVPWNGSVLWLRARVELKPEQLGTGRPLALYIAAIASHEVWWDGELLGRGGVVGDGAKTETPGPIETHYLVPERLATVGSHQLAIRTSAFHRHFSPKTGYWGVYIGEYDRIVSFGTRQTRLALVSFSGMVMVALFALMMFFQDRRDTSFLFLGLLCLTGAMLLIAESWRSLVGYTYNWHFLRLVAVTGLAWLLDVFLLVFLARRFPMRGGRWFVLAGVVAATVPLFVYPSWDPKAIFGFFGVFSLCACWCLAAIVRRLRGGLLALLGLGVCLATLFHEPGAFVDRYLYLSLDFLLVCLLASHVLQTRQERREREEALLKSARLEIELLKRHIQPHFMLNTLTALSEWIEEQPKLATRMIQSLAEEFRVLADISNQRLIRMEDEIRLCRSHLEIMSQRKKREYRMTTEGIDAAASIPPAVIHTLVENAITHNHYEESDIEFRLSEERRDGFRHYVFTSPLGSGAEGADPSEGTGLRYIRARLQESFGDRFRLRSRAEGNHWRTEISIPAGA